MARSFAIGRHFGARLQELRQQAALTQQQLADKAGLKVGGIRDLEQGINELPWWDTVLALTKAGRWTVVPFRSSQLPGPSRK
jgi:transcriptional regulator with XRE-family HTH domain